MNLRFYHCDICGKIVTVLSGTDIPTICCGKVMQELIPNLTDGAVEKHVPVFTADSDTVTVRIGSIPHPMTDAHCITWIGLCTDKGFQFKELNPGSLPEACFSICTGEHIESVYAFCNLHGLWCSETEAVI